MKTFLKKIITIAICCFAVFATCSYADIMEPDMPVKPKKNDNFIFYNVSSENEVGYRVVANNTSNTTSLKNNTTSSSENEEEEIDFAKIMIIAGGSIATITAIAIVILAFVSKK